MSPLYSFFYFCGALFECCWGFFPSLLFKDQTKPRNTMYISTLCISLGRGESRNENDFLSVRPLSACGSIPRVPARSPRVIFGGLASDVSGKHTSLTVAKLVTHVGRHQKKKKKSRRTCSCPFTSAKWPRGWSEPRPRYASVAPTRCRRGALCIAVAVGCDD